MVPLIVIGVLGALSIIAFVIVLARERAVQLPKWQLRKKPSEEQPDKEQVTNTTKSTSFYLRKVGGAILGLVWKVLILGLVIVAIYVLVSFGSSLDIPGKERIESIFIGSEYSSETVIHRCKREPLCDYRIISFSQVSDLEPINIMSKKLMYINLASQPVYVEVLSLDESVLATFELPVTDTIYEKAAKEIYLDDPDVFVRLRADTVGQGTKNSVIILITDKHTDTLQKMGY